jgi:ADP-ribose pyrophosphatase YjhB (NUDIX family)
MHTTDHDFAVQLIQIADQLRALSNNGLRWSPDAYHEERYRKILGLSAQLLSMVEQRSLPEIERIFFNDLEYITPFAVVDTAVFDEAGRLLLIQRADNRLWAMPGGAREVWEESGYIVEVSHLIGVFDSRYCRQNTSRHLYHLLFAGRVIGGEATASVETLDVQWFAPERIPWPSLSPGHELRIRHGLQWYAHPGAPAFFDDERWRPLSRP